MTRAVAAALAAWQALNARQRAYLALAYAVDREHEAAEGAAWACGGRRRPAEEWRWLDYGETWGGPSALLIRLRLRGLADQGAGPTWQALRRRGLLAVRYTPRPGAEPLAAVRLTPLGRRVARAGLGEAPPARLPSGTLRAWHWRALALAYAAPTGVSQDDEPDGRYGGIGWPTWRRLRDHRAGALVAERVIDWRAAAYPGGVATPVRRLFLTAAGRRCYAEVWEEYRVRYPTVAAPEPVLPGGEGDHPGEGAPATAAPDLPPRPARHDEEHH